MMFSDDTDYKYISVYGFNFNRSVMNHGQTDRLFTYFIV